MRFQVFYTNKTESNEVASFDTIDEAVAYCKEQVSGEEPFNGDTGDLCGFFKYEVYDGTAFNEETGLGTPIYETRMHWENR